MHVPERLPFAPRPISTELLSSWLMRVAAANLIPLEELLNGLTCRYGPVLSNAPIDYAIPEAGVMALAKFCRVAPEAIRMLDLSRRLPRINPAMFIGFTGTGFQPTPGSSSQRVGYGFCPRCIDGQRAIHVPWEWSLRCLSRCAIHRRPLLHGCPACGEPEPLSFAPIDSSRTGLCQSCGGHLGGSSDGVVDIAREGNVQLVQDDYRAALNGAAPVLLPKATPNAFRSFFEEMVHLLARSLDRGTGANGGAYFSRSETVEMIAMLVLNAAWKHPQSARHGVQLWAALLSIIPEDEGERMERISIRWPVELRRRFVTGLRHRVRKRWPHTPYRPATETGRAFRRDQIAAVFGLSSVRFGSAAISAI